MRPVLLSGCEALTDDAIKVIAATYLRVGFCDNLSATESIKLITTHFPALAALLDIEKCATIMDESIMSIAANCQIQHRELR